MSKAKIIPSLTVHREANEHGRLVMFPLIYPLISFKDNDSSTARRSLYEKMIGKKVPWPKTWI